MPPLPSVSDVFRSEFQQTLGEDSNILNRLFWSFTGAITVAVAEALATEIASAFSTHISPLLNPDHVLDAVQVQDLSSDTGAMGVAESGTAGGISGNLLPAEIAMVIKHGIPRHYRGGHPRWYQCGFNQVNLADAQTWTSGIQTDAADAYAAFLDELIGYSTGGCTITNPVNVSYYSGFTAVKYPSGRYHNVPNVREIPLVDIIGTITINPKVGSQRRRSLQSR